MPTGRAAKKPGEGICVELQRSGLQSAWRHCPIAEMSNRARPDLTGGALQSGFILPSFAALHNLVVALGTAS